GLGEIEMELFGSYSFGVYVVSGIDFGKRKVIWLRGLYRF
nr:hypothetical protein [Tanacetum cinerariifolium]